MKKSILREQSVNGERGMEPDDVKNRETKARTNWALHAAGFYKIYKTRLYMYSQNKQIQNRRLRLVNPVISLNNVNVL